MQRAALLLVLAILACGDEQPIVQQRQPSPASQAASISLGERTGIVHEVQMMGDLNIGFRFEPSELTIKVGDTVRWINGSGFPHNVAFYADSMPNGANGLIDALMPAENKLGPMNGRIVSEMGDTFEMDFVSAPTGSYRYFSVPQEALGMVGTIIVESQ
jgi:plastocyanin